MKREILEKRIYKHFKGNLYKVITIATDSETNEEVVVYQDIIKKTVWVRPYNMFNSLVDKEKYPDVFQKYRFELEDNND